MGREFGVYMPEPCGGNATPQSNDVFVEHDSGLIHLVDRFWGYDIMCGRNGGRSYSTPVL